MTAIIDHVGLSATDFERSKAFYTAALGALGIKPIWEFAERGEAHVGYGKDRPTFWLGGRAAPRRGAYRVRRSQPRRGGVLLCRRACQSAAATTASRG